MMGANRKQLE